MPDRKAGDICLPSLNERLPPARALPMDDYLQFCLDNLRDCSDAESIMRRRKQFPAPVQFRLRDVL